MKILEYLSETENKYNEDYIGFGNNYAFILDGASGLVKNKITLDSDAKWYVNELGKILKNELKQNIDLKTILKNSIKKMSDELKKYDIQNYLELPSACIAIVREYDDNIEFLVMGDCSIIIKNNNSLELLTTNEIRKLDGEKIEKMKEIDLKNNISVKESLKYIIDDLKAQRKLRNNINGYYVLDDKIEAIDYAMYKIINKKDVDKIVLMSDGFSTYYECLKIVNNYKEFYEECMNNDVEKLYQNLRTIEKNDQDLNKFPRYKVSDDASIIKIELEDK